MINDFPDKMAEMHEDDYDWQPPTESEMKILQARRERSDKISKLMGDYLLKGHKMLAITCQQCNTILLQDKQGTNYCIACKELDTDVSKDDPVLSSAAARSQMLEDSRTDDCDTNDMAAYMGRREQQPNGAQQYRAPEPRAPAPSVQPPATTTATARAPAPPAQTPVTTSTTARLAPSGVRTVSVPSGSSNVTVDFVDSAETLRQKIQWATEELRTTNSVEYSMSLCQMIKCAADAIFSLKQAS